MRTIFAAIAAIVVAGCAGPSDVATTDNQNTEPSVEDTEPTVEDTEPNADGFTGTLGLRDVVIYDFTGQVAGAAAPPAPGLVPPTKVDSFQVVNGTTELSFEASFAGGASVGYARIEVYAPDGKLAYATNDEACGMAAGTGACLNLGSPTSPGEAIAGTYEVHYEVVGVFDLALQVTATQP